MLGMVFIFTSYLRVAHSACPRIYSSRLTQLVRSGTMYVRGFFFPGERHVNIHAAAKKQAHLEVECWYSDVVGSDNDEVEASRR